MFMLFFTKKEKETLVAKKEIRILGFVNKMASAIVEVPYGEDQVLEIDSPVKLTGKIKIQVNKSGEILTKIEVRPIPQDDTPPFFVDAKSICLM